MKQVILSARNVNKSYSVNKELETKVLFDISLDIYKNEITAIVGASGVGKSTLLYLLGTLDKPCSGEIMFYDDEKHYNYSKLNDTDLASLRNKKIGFVFQFHHLLPEFTALENVTMPALIAGENFSAAKAKAKELIERVGLIERCSHKPQELSGGEQQRIAIARAMINSPAVILADEPTGNLDSANSGSFIKLIKEMKETFDTTFVIATHSGEVASIADRVINMKNGRLSD